MAKTRRKWWGRQGQGIESAFVSKYKPETLMDHPLINGAIPGSLPHADIEEFRNYYGVDPEFVLRYCSSPRVVQELLLKG